MFDHLKAIRWRFITKSLVCCVIAAWLVIVALAWAFQRQLTYMPSDDMRQPAALGLSGVEQITFETPDGAKLTTWVGAAETGKPTILYYHGNGGALTHRQHKFAQLRAQGYGLFAISYRSFSGSTGVPSEAANVADALHAYDGLRGRGVAAADIVVFGESLGSGVAVQVAAARPVAAVILESPYSSVTDVAKHRYWFLPVDLAIRDRYDSVRHVQRVTAPILILAGATDTIVPVQFSRRLAEAVPGQKRYVEYPEGWHVNLLQLGGLDEVKAWVAKRHGRSGP